MKILSCKEPQLCDLGWLNISDPRARDMAKFQKTHLQVEVELDDGTTACMYADISKVVIEQFSIDEPLPVIVEKQKTYIGLHHAIDPDNPKKTIKIWEWCDVDQTPIYFLDEDCTNLITDINEYEMSNIAGSVIPENLAGLTKSACVTMCIDPASTITLQDVLDEGIADGILLPDGTAPTGFLIGSIMSFSIGQLGLNAAGELKKVGAQVIHYDTDESINAGSTYCPEENEVLTDDDCDKFLVGSDLTRTIENPSTEPAIVRVCGTFIPLDTDDDDQTVQRVGGGEDVKG